MIRVTLVHQPNLNTGKFNYFYIPRWVIWTTLYCVPTSNILYNYSILTSNWIRALFSPLKILPFIWLKLWVRFLSCNHPSSNNLTTIFNLVYHYDVIILVLSRKVGQFKYPIEWYLDPSLFNLANIFCPYI